MATGADPLQTAIALHKAGDLTRAEQLYAQVLASNPRHADALHLLGLVAHERGDHARAIDTIRQAIDIQPQAAVYHGNLGEALRALARLGEARASYQEALRLDPTLASAHYNLGCLNMAAKDWPRAIDGLETALRLKPDFVDARCSLAHALWLAGRADEAAAQYAAAIRHDPNHIETLLGYGRLLEAQGRGSASLEMADRLVRLRPEMAEAHSNRALALGCGRRLDEAVAELHEALRLQPRNVEAYENLAVTLHANFQPDEAIECCRRGLEVDPASAALRRSLALGLQAQGRGALAVESYRDLVARHPADAAAHSALLYALNFIDGCDPAAVFDEHLEWARRHAEPLARQAAPHGNDRTPDRRLKVGYVSAHFYQHAVDFFVEPILLAHDHREFEVFCYASVARPDAVTTRLQAAADHWRDVHLLSEEQLAETVRRDEIDILVDLAGHMGRPRLLAFARRPAPVQVTYIGYQNTTGMSAMDYRLTDGRADPPGTTDAYYTERLVRLPRSFFCYRPGECPDVSPLPAGESGRVTFGSFNSFIKVTPRVIDAWLQVLARVADSRLRVLVCPPGHARRDLIERAEQAGIDPARIEFHGRYTRGEYLRQLQQIDIALDPFPFNGHTTTCDAIWMGVPVVMLEGDTYHSRFGGCVLAPVGLDHLIARSVDAYVDVAANLAGDPQSLAQLRRELRPRMAESVLLDFQGFARSLESAYRRMWIDWCGQAGSAG